MDMAKELYNINVKEDYIANLDLSLLSILLKDKTTGKNIIWATDTYTRHGKGYKPQDTITTELITGKHSNIIKPRTEKSQREQRNRVRGNAEVFTPSWIANKQNNLVDNAWFGRENIFNIEAENGWTAVTEKIAFSDEEGKTWQDYVKATCLEVACGEAPYLTSRYDAVSGAFINIRDRIGRLDRKLRVVSENTTDEQDWYGWAVAAYKSVYGYDFQGDNVLIARENLLFSFIDAYMDKFGVPPLKEYLEEIAKILAYNIWQMDGLKLVVPYSCHHETIVQLSLFDVGEPKPEFCAGCRLDNPREHNGTRCYIMDWATNRRVKYVDLLWR